MDSFDTWIGKKEISKDFINSRPIEMMQAFLNEDDKNLNILPHLYHWFYFLPIIDSKDIAKDGHPHKGDFLPPIPFPKRMWAGSRLQFFSPIHINQNIRRESEILKIEFKNGKSGDMYFVTVKHSIYTEDTLAIVEEHDIVYREEKNQVQAFNEVTSSIDSRPFTYKHQFPLDTVSLFKYSAITFNAHRIHYDYPYATQVEGYPGLIVHGPLLATLLLHTFKKENPFKEVSNFEFRAVSPVFDFNKFSICGDIQSTSGELWIEKDDGSIAMKAKVSFKGE